MRVWKSTPDPFLATRKRVGTEAGAVIAEGELPAIERGWCCVETGPALEYHVRQYEGRLVGRVFRRAGERSYTYGVYRLDDWERGISQRSSSLDGAKFQADRTTDRIRRGDEREAVRRREASEEAAWQAARRKR